MRAWIAFQSLSQLKGTIIIFHPSFAYPMHFSSSPSSSAARGYADGLDESLELEPCLTFGRKSVLFPSF